MDIRALLLESEPLLLFVVIGLGYLLGQTKIFGIQLGISGVLFAGLLIGAWQPEGAGQFAIAPQITEVGLILFVYTVGLSTGSGFFSSFGKRGLSINLSVLVALVLGALAAVVLGRHLGLSPEMVAGVFCGSLTNTPALGAVTELVKSSEHGSLTAPTLGYSVSYPIGLIGGLLSLQLVSLIRKRKFVAEKLDDEKRTAEQSSLLVQNFELTNSAIFGKAIGELRIQSEIGVVISRVQRGERVFVPTKYTSLEQGDLIVAVGSSAAIERAADYFGVLSNSHIERKQEQVAYRRILLSDKRFVGKPLADLELDQKFNAQVTRLRRGDVDLAASADTRLELGDRLRVVAPVEQIDAVSKYLGDSELQRADLDFAALTLAISLGVLLGMVPLPIPGGAVIRLGFAGGPLVVGLVFGKICRTGRFTWILPLEANLTLRHIGLLFFLAGVGITAGSRFVDALSAAGMEMLLVALTVAVLTNLLAMLFFMFYCGSSVISTMGAASGLQTQPATLARARELSGSDEVFVAYATSYPIAMIGKIVLAQLIVICSSLF